VQETDRPARTETKTEVRRLWPRDKGARITVLFKAMRDDKSHRLEYLSMWTAGAEHERHTLRQLSEQRSEREDQTTLRGEVASAAL